MNNKHGRSLYDRNSTNVIDGKNDNPDEYTPLKNGQRQYIVSGLDRSLKTLPLGEQTCAVQRQVIMVILGNIGILASGMGLGFPTVTLQELTSVDNAVHLTKSQATWFASINTLSSPLGGLLSGILLDKFGRKNTLYVLNVLTLLAWLLLAIASQQNLELFCWQLMTSRFITGIGMGLSSATVGVYSAEISLPKMRGHLILGTSISIAAGITLIYTIGYFIRNDFRLIALICCVYQLISFLFVMPMPETPSWLLSKQHIEKAKESLNFFRGLQKSAEITHPEVQKEFLILQKSLQSADGEVKPSFLNCLCLPEVYKPLLILIGLFAFMQLSGVFVIIVYAVQISVEAGVTIDPFMCAVLIGAARVITTCPMGIILEKWGRRRSGIISALGMCMCMLLLACDSWFEFIKSIPYLPVVAMVAYIVFSTLGIFTLPYFMISELFPQRVRGPASGLTVAISMFLAFLSLKTYPGLRATFGNDICFVFFGIMAFFAMIFIYMLLPETRGRTLLEIENQFRKQKSLPKTPNELEMQQVMGS